MKPTDPRLIRRALTMVATLILVAAVVVMHSLMTGHAPLTHPGQTSAASRHFTGMPVSAITGMTTSTMVSDMVPTQEPHPATASGAQATSITHAMGDMCLAVLPVLLLLLVLTLRRLDRKRTVARSTRWVGWQLAALRGSPPRRLTPSLSQLCVLRT